MNAMFTLPSFLALLLPLPALGDHEGSERRRKLNLLRLPHHLRRDIGADDYENPADDPRWARRFDLER
ncbi:hypothetical protein [Devosia aurantiaca]|nr:hypothetical protein [Devosia aurantiaca]